MNNKTHTNLVYDQIEKRTSCFDGTVDFIKSVYFLRNKQKVLKFHNIHYYCAHIEDYLKQLIANRKSYKYCKWW